jgi:hypothetical protein
VADAPPVAGRESNANWQWNWHGGLRVHGYKTGEECAADTDCSTNGGDDRFQPHVANGERRTAGCAHGGQIRRGPAQVKPKTVRGGGGGGVAATSPPQSERFEGHDRTLYADTDAPPSPEYDDSESSVSGSEDEYARTRDVVFGEIKGEVNLSEYMIEVERKFQAELLEAASRAREAGSEGRDETPGQGGGRRNWSAAGHARWGEIGEIVRDGFEPAAAALRLGATPGYDRPQLGGLSDADCARPGDAARHDNNDPGDLGRGRDDADDDPYTSYAYGEIDYGNETDSFAADIFGTDGADAVELSPGTGLYEDDSDDEPWIGEHGMGASGRRVYVYDWATSVGHSVGSSGDEQKNVNAKLGVGGNGSLQSYLGGGSSNSSSDVHDNTYGVHEAIARGGKSAEGAVAGADGLNAVKRNGGFLRASRVDFDRDATPAHAAAAAISLGKSPRRRRPRATSASTAQTHGEISRHWELLQRPPSRQRPPPESLNLFQPFTDPPASGSRSGPGFITRDIPADKIRDGTREMTRLSDDAHVAEAGEDRASALASRPSTSGGGGRRHAFFGASQLVPRQGARPPSRKASGKYHAADRARGCGISDGVGGSGGIDGCGIGGGTMSGRSSSNGDLMLTVQGRAASGAVPGYGKGSSRPTGMAASMLPHASTRVQEGGEHSRFG